MLSNLQIVLLSQLRHQPLTGYDLTKRIQHSPWTASHQQVYRELAKLEMKKMVVVQEIPQQGKPDKKQYSITDKGQAALDEPELMKPIMKKVQDNANAMLFLGGPEYFRNLKSRIAQRLVAIDEMRHQGADALMQLALNREQRLLEVDAEWCQDVISVFSSQNHQTSQAA